MGPILDVALGILSPMYFYGDIDDVGGRSEPGPFILGWGLPRRRDNLGYCFGNLLFYACGYIVGH